ncbi:MAG: peptidoglycan DD-metalloendopeptidase family protein [Sphingomonadales bacterium]|nr:peptidoglycan DD-metalloendopeptidase family protein [Sphingomonadales bacterium]
MDDDSFDPRSWAKPQQGAAKPQQDTAPAAIPAAAQPAESPPPASESGSAASSLPEAWRDIGTAFAPKPDAATHSAAKPAVAATSKPTRTASGMSPLLPLLLSLALLIGGGLAAWMTRHEVKRPAAPQQAVAEAPAAPEVPPSPGEVERSLVLAGVSDIVGALTAAGVSPQEAQAAAKAAAQVLAKPGEIHATLSLMPQGKAFLLQGLKASYADGSGAVVTRDSAGAFSGAAVAAELTQQIKVLRGEIDSESFYTSAVSAGVIDTLIPEFINAFTYDFNLASEINPGDTFEVAWAQSVNAQGGAVGQPQLLFASLTTPQKSLALYRFVSPDGKVAWYDGNGASTQRGLMRTPVDGARITSKFGMRFHPVLHYTRLHAGVDFGVPVGTPVYAAAAGVVIGATPTGCGGNMVVIQHDNGWVTRYFHLSHYAEGLHEGQRVSQGYTVGLSGTTGSCTTGPHLHFELRIGGEPVDPLSVKTDDSERKKLDGTSIQAFMHQRDRVDVARAKQAM